MNERTRATSFSLRPSEEEAFEALAKAAGTSRSGLLRKWIRLASQGDEPGPRIILTLEREGAEVATGTKDAEAPEEPGRKAVQDGKAVNVFFPPSPKRQQEIARAEEATRRYKAQQEAERLAKLDRAERTGQMFGSKPKQ